MEISYEDRDLLVELARDDMSRFLFMLVQTMDLESLPAKSLILRALHGS